MVCKALFSLVSASLSSLMSYQSLIWTICHNYAQLLPVHGEYQAPSYLHNLVLSSAKNAPLLPSAIFLQKSVLPYHFVGQIPFQFLKLSLTYLLLEAFSNTTVHTWGLFNAYCTSMPLSFSFCMNFLWTETIIPRVK